MKQTKKNKPTPKQLCSECIHICACAAWNVGSIASMDGTNCANFERFAVNTAPVVHGKWVLRKVEGGYHHICSNCFDAIGTNGEPYENPLSDPGTFSENYLYCRRCGAKMDKECE